MQMELANVQRERQQLEQQRKLLKCTGPCAPCACCPLPPSTCVTPTPGLPLKGSAVPPAQIPVQSSDFFLFIFFKRFSCFEQYKFLHTFHFVDIFL